MATLDATPGGATANSYLTLAEAEEYFETRLFTEAWEDADDQEKSLMMATRIIDRLLSPMRMLVRDPNRPYYRIRPEWNGAPTTTTQRLAWPRTGMTDANGNAIADTVIPLALKEAVAELAMQLNLGDRTLDSDVKVQGITSLRAGSVALSFKNDIDVQVIPDAVWNLLVPSWYTDEIIEYIDGAFFDVV